MKKFITDLDVVPSIRQPIEILCDNTGAIAQAKEPRSHHKAKHIQRKFHYIREIVERGDIVISKVDTDQNLADPFTKPMTQEKHDLYRDAIGLRFAIIKALIRNSSEVQWELYVVNKGFCTLALYVTDKHRGALVDSNW
ncbi:hypothetical protein L1987_74818 [Smallanthus sonchifolius]|uniref:Uncharacterized protein n=1 Tax=Smallanthus sonchifolius TaxID=185202 RepID=A0ACB9A3Y9_9ASTR|nr:hypothetical protein L1987_74818 [Smallanthus sonchifolius]